MEIFHAFFESLDAWWREAIPDMCVYAMQYTHSQSMSTEYNLISSSYIIQLTQVEQNIAHHACFLIAKHDNLMSQDKAQACADRADHAWDKVIEFLKSKGFENIKRARIGIPDALTVTYTYLPKGFLDAETHQP